MSGLHVDDFFVLRVPRFPVGQVAGLPADGAALRAFLLEWSADPVVEEALYVASPSLHERLKPWNGTRGEGMPSKLVAPLLKYFVRMSTRPTPFGLFSGVRLGRFAGRNRLLCGAAGEVVRKTRLDMSVLGAVHGLFPNDPLASSCAYEPNRTIQRAGASCYYIEPREENGRRVYRLSSFENDPHLDEILRSAEGGATARTIVDAFVALHAEAERDQVEAFVAELIGQSILVKTQLLPVTGGSVEADVGRALASMGAGDIAAALDGCLERMGRMDAGVVASPADYAAIGEMIGRIGVAPDCDPPVQVDLSPVFEECSLDADIFADLLSAAPMMLRRKKANAALLDEFAKQFAARYGEQEVPLVEALNDETGIGFGSQGHRESDLLADLPWASSFGEAGDASSTQSVMQMRVAAAIASRLAKAAPVLHLPVDSASADPGFQQRLPSSFSFLVGLYEDADGRPIVHFKGSFGPPASMLIGRFCHLDESLREHARAHLRREERHSPDVLFAEIAHLPDGRAGNVSVRPHLREYEITFFTGSSLPEERRILPTELSVAVRDGEVILWCERLRRRIIPRMSTAHNYSVRSLTIYKFLCALAHQRLELPQFALPVALEEAASIPRVMYGNVILQEMRWRLPRSELVALAGARDGSGEAVAAVLDRYGMDPIVAFARADNVLAIDLRCPEALAILLAETRGMAHVVLAEFLPLKLRPMVRRRPGPGDGDGDAAMANEAVVPCLNPGAKPYRPIALPGSSRSIAGKEVRRRFSPGSEWMSLRIFGAPSVIDEVLARTLAPGLENLLRVSGSTKWFFIRYGDPQWHLRLRFHGDPARLGGFLLPALEAMLEPYLAAGTIPGIEAFAYEREIERYGGPEGMLLAEDFFAADSRLALRLLLAEDGEDAGARWRYAIPACIEILDRFGFSGDHAIRLIGVVRNHFGTEFGETNEFRVQLGKKFRSLRVAESLRGPASPMTYAIREFGEAIARVGREYRALHAEGRLVRPLEDIVASFLHMHNNRLFIADNRRHEFVIYDFVRRLLVSEAARARA